MRSIASKVTVSLALMIMAILLLPVLVSAETTTAVTETAYIKPGANDNDELVNVANDTIRTNIDTWSARPAGIFVGGTIEESKIQLHEMASGDDAQLLLTTVIQPRQEYLMSGVSEFVVRLPVAIDPDNMPKQVNFGIWALSSSAYSVVNDGVYSDWPGFRTRQDENPYHPVWSLIAHQTALRLAGESVMTIFNVAHLNPTPRPHTPAWPDLPLWADAAHSSYLLDGRLYVKIICPMLPDFYYVMATQVFYQVGQAFEFFICPSDLASDNLTNSHVAYTYWPAPDLAVYRDEPVPADLGYSFVFESGLGGHAYEYNSFYGTEDILEWVTYVRIAGASASGALNFMLEYRTNSTTPIEWQLDVVEESTWDLDTGISGIWWTHKTSNAGYILASNPVNRTYPTVTIGGNHYLAFHCFLTIQTPARLQVMTVTDPSWPAGSNWLVHASPTTGGANYFDDILGFGMWCTISVQNVSLNETSVLNLGAHHTGFWEGIGHWWEAHWMDIIGGELIIIGALLIVITGWTGVGAVFGLALIAIGVGMILYNNHILDGILQMIIDGLSWLGNWLWKIGQFIWKALTWFVDQLVYFGAILIGMLMVVVALLIFIFPLYMEVKILGAIYYLVQGDVARASSALEGAVAPIKSAGKMIGRGG